MDKIKLIEKFKEARGLIAKEENWCQIAYAYRGLQPISIALERPDKNCDRFCSIAAIYSVCDPPLSGYSYMVGFISDFCMKRKGAGIVMFNDDPKRTHSQVIELWDDFITHLEKS